MGKTIVILIGHGLSGKCVTKDLRDELSKINLVVIESREHWECDSLSPVFLFSPEVFDKNSVAVFGKKVDGVPYMNDIVESVSPSNGGGGAPGAESFSSPSSHPSMALCIWSTPGCTIDGVTTPS